MPIATIHVFVAGTLKLRVLALRGTPKRRVNIRVSWHETVRRPWTLARTNPGIPKTQRNPTVSVLPPTVVTFHSQPIDRLHGMAPKNTARLSTNFQLSILKSTRMARQWEAGQVFAFIPKRGGMLLVPVPEMADLTGLARGANPKYYRDRIGRV